MRGAAVPQLVFSDQSSPPALLYSAINATVSPAVGPSWITSTPYVVVAAVAVRVTTTLRRLPAVGMSTWWPLAVVSASSIGVPSVSS